MGSFPDRLILGGARNFTAFEAGSPVAGMDREVILPARNAVDLDDVPDQVLDDLTVHLVEDVRDVLELALEPAA